MIQSRYARLGLALLLTGFVGVALYLYQNLDAILRHQVQQSLQEYGVEDYTLEKPRLGNGRIKVDRLWLRGNYDLYAYEATLTSLEIRYEWHLFLQRKVQSISLSDLDITVHQATSAFKPEPGPGNFAIGSLLPQTLLAQLPLQTLDIGRWKLDFRSPGIPDVLATGNLLYSGHLEVAAKSTLGGSDFAVALRTDENTSSTEFTFALHDAETAVSNLFATLQPLTRGEWEWQLRGDWSYAPLLSWLDRLATETDLPLATSIPDDLLLIGNGEVTAHIRHPETLSTPLALDWSALQPFEATVQMINNIEQLDYPGTIEGIAGTLDTSLTLLDGHLQLGVKPFQLSGELATRLLTRAEDTRLWLQWQETVPVLWDSPETLNLAYKEGKWSGQLHSTVLELGDSQSQLRLERLNLDVSLDTTESLLLSTQLNTSIKTRLRKQQLPQLELALRQQGNIDQSPISVNIADTAESLSVDLEGTANLTTGSGNYQLSVQSQDLPYFTRAALPPLRNLGLLESDLEILSGRIELDTTLNTTGFEPASWTQESQLALGNVSGTYDEYHFENLALMGHWTGIERWKTVQPVQFSLQRLDMGFAVRDIVARASLPKATAIAQPSLRIEEFSAGLFGGQLFLPEPGNWDFAASSNTLTLQAQGWQLAEMVALQQAEDIHAQGTLEGELPFTMTDGRVSIEKGYLKALPPGGSIRYIANDASRTLGKNSSELALALDLLSDFQYEVLSSAVELDKGGNLLLGLSLAGRNPDQFEGRQVNFNINLEQNLDPLLQSLRLSDKLTEEIENRLQ
jgi:hypothetical protein